jgi:DNA transposition AAA+ family ATPase
MITKDLKNRVLEAIANNRPNFKSDAQQARALGINSAQLSRINKGELEGVLSEAKWITIARRLDVQIGTNIEWKTAKTPVFNFVYGQLKTCQEKSISGILCDNAGIGKTYTAKVYVKQNKYAIYIDCSQVKTKQKLVRQICKEFGVDNRGRYQDVYEDLVFYLRSIPTPIIILDEAGDLNYDAFLECKGLWNATERCTAWYMMGADGLKKKIESNRGRKKVGYAEIFDRYGNKFQKATPEGKEALDEFTKLQVALVVKANNPNSDIQKVYAATGGSLRRVFIELQKQASA